jgi:hypothetical protein
MITGIAIRLTATCALGFFGALQYERERICQTSSVAGLPTRPELGTPESEHTWLLISILRRTEDPPK